MPLPLPSSGSGEPGGHAPLPQPPGDTPPLAPPSGPPTGRPTPPPSVDGPPTPPVPGRGEQPTTTTCYRHADRTAGRRCTRCGRPACEECLVAASVGSHCRECAKAARPDIRTRANFWQAGQSALVAYALIGLNIAAFIGLGLWSDIGGMLAGRITDAHLEFGLNTFFIDGQIGIYTLTDGSVHETQGDEWYRLVTSGFLHFGIIHLAMNMYFLYLLGNEMEPMLGRVRFGLLYLASLLGGSAGVVLIDQGSITAGASGAVFGLLGAYAVGVWRHGVNVFSTQIGSLLLINLFLTFTISNISIGGHIGGLVAGGICGFVMLAPGYKGVPDWSKYVAPIIVAVVAVAISVVAAAA